MDKILIGKIVNAVGLRGEVKVYSYSDGMDIYENTKAMYVGDELMNLQNVRSQKNMIVLKFDGIDDRDAAERSKGREIFVTEKDLPELEDGVYYVRDLIGMEVACIDGEHLGHVTDVIQNTAQDIFEVETDEGRKVLIPRVPAFVKEIDQEKKRISVTLIEGMLDL